MSPRSLPSPDRYADAVRARRAELAQARALLGGAHRTELRSELALSRIAASDAATTALGQLSRETRVHVERSDPSGRHRLPGLLASALDTLALDVHARWAADLTPGLCRIASTRGLDLGPPALPAPRLPLVTAPPVAERVRPARSLFAGAAEGMLLWRLVLLPVVALPLLGLPVVGGPALAPLAAGAGVAGAVVAVRSRRAARERAALRRCTDELLAAGRVALEVDLARRLLELARSLGATLDAAVARRRAALEAELRSLSPEVVPGA
jgi:hypothetical protein